MESSQTVSYFKKVEELLRLLTILNLTGYRWPDPACVRNGASYDFVVIGGGAAGCLVASQLVETGNASVLLVEAGGYPPIESELAGLFAYLKGSEHDWNFTSTCGSASSTHKDNVISMSQGKMLGGSSSLGYLVYGHGSPHDYDEWAAITNDPSWSYDSILPIMQRSEQLIDHLLQNCSHYYGTDGEIKLQKQYYPRNRPYFQALKEIGYNCYLDINPDHPLGFTSFLFTIGDDVRQTTALKYISPLKNHPNLDLLINALATKIVFDENNNAVGVKILKENGRTITVRANKEVIVTAGTIKSPQLLMLSGIGPSGHLQNKGIEVIADLPVGKNFQDHVNSFLLYKMTRSGHASSVEDPHKYPYAGFEGYGALNKNQSYPDFNLICAHFGDRDTFLGLCAFFFSFDNEFCDSLGEGLDDKEAFLVFVTNLNPESRGEILLASKNPEDNPVILPGYFTESIDLENQANYLADFNRVLNTTYFRRMDAELVTVGFESCAEFPMFSEDYWKCHALKTLDTSHYFVGTCAMGSVLDSRLRVRGVNKLRVADASAMPTNVRSYTLATVHMIAQKATEMIIEEHRLRG
ncbi:unnamed protein product [Chrysodeixis includens]|uniref:Glucose-methanol-choline oxidoreductase N-terminal domain-containing protein n=1 Tax=Chrysodeixis includens TaxID=689277 RepID=A0A9P0BSF6_CHRIL|nr:unnamed protein product [Chrysodeixis includens]